MVDMNELKDRFRKSVTNGILNFFDGLNNDELEIFKTLNTDKCAEMLAEFAVLTLAKWLDREDAA